MKPLLKTTTAMIAALGLLNPLPLVAQDTAPDICAETPDAPECAPEAEATGAGEAPAEGAAGVETPAEPAAPAEPAQADAAPEAGGETGDPAAEGTSMEAADAPATTAEIGAEAEAGVETGAEAEATAETGPESGAEAETTAEAETEGETEAAGVGQNAADDAPQADAAPEDGAAAPATEATEAPAPETPDAPASGGGDDTAGADTDATAGTDAAAAESAESEATSAAPDAQTETAGDAGDTTASESAVEADASADAETAESNAGGVVPEADTAESAPEATEPAAPAEATENTGEAADPTGDTAGAEGGTDSAAETQTDTSADQPRRRNVQTDVPSDAPRSSEDRAAEGGAMTAVAAEEGAAPQDSETVEITEDRARRSDEDFDEAIDQDPDDDDDGLSRFEQSLLAGAAGLAIGTLLNNRSVVASAPDRVVVQGADGLEILKDDTAILQRPGSEVRTETFEDGSTRVIVTRADGSRVVTLRDPQLNVLRRVVVSPDGTRTVLIDDTRAVEPVDRAQLQQTVQQSRAVDPNDAAALAEALRAVVDGIDRSYSLSQVRNIYEVRGQVPALDLETIQFATGSAAIGADQAQALSALGRFIADAVAEDPRRIFLVEGHTDAVGGEAYNLALSDRRAESVALALSEYFDVPTENLVVQGYGERFLKVDTEAAEAANRRATLRDITPLLQIAAAQ